MTADYLNVHYLLTAQLSAINKTYDHDLTVMQLMI